MSKQKKDDDKMEIKQAEARVERSLNEFESAMERLENKVGIGAEKVHKVVDLAHRTKETVDEAKSSALLYLNKGRSAGERIFNSARGSSRDLALKVKQNPRPFMFGAIAGIAGILILRSLLKRSSRLEDTVATSNTSF